jgi:phosphatidylserine/phosphatidylglycerophosphate/cardiolipin synthase-like enzyme
MLTMYATMVDAATDLSCITLAFGINKEFKEQLKDNTPLSHLAFFLLEKKDVPNPKTSDAFIEINSKQNVYKAWGSYLKDTVYQWAKETNNRALEFNTHVAYIHSKFLLKDPLGLDPIVVTGSANFSDDSQRREMKT